MQTATSSGVSSPFADGQRAIEAVDSLSERIDLRKAAESFGVAFADAQDALALKTKRLDLFEQVRSGAKTLNAATREMNLAIAKQREEASDPLLQRLDRIIALLERGK